MDHVRMTFEIARTDSPSVRETWGWHQRFMALVNISIVGHGPNTDELVVAEGHFNQPKSSLQIRILLDCRTIATLRFF